MYLLLLGLLALTSSVAGESLEDLFPNRIVGGYPIPITSAPYQVSISYDGQFICGGSIINRRFILSAAHCFETGRKDLYRIRAGSKFFHEGGQKRRISKVEVNSRYNKQTQDHDAAIVKLDSPLHYTQGVQPIELPSEYEPASRSAIVSGWGVLGENLYNPAHTLRAVRVNFLSVPKCNDRYGNMATITKNMICAGELQDGGKDSCQGDSGGPLVEHGVQYGIVSFGVGCARRRYPGVYTSVFMIKRWIKKVISNL